MLVLAVVAATMALPATSSAETVTASASCRAVFGPDGFSARTVKARRIACRSARSVLRRWLRANGQPITGPTGWRCKYNVGGRPGRWHCRRTGKLIAFTYYADEP